jgi:hypothetical protein
MAGNFSLREGVFKNVEREVAGLVIQSPRLTRAAPRPPPVGPNPTYLQTPSAPPKRVRFLRETSGEIL